MLVCGDCNLNSFNINSICIELNLVNIVTDVTRPASGTILDIFLVPECVARFLCAEVGPPLSANSICNSNHCSVLMKSSVNHVTENCTASKSQKYYTVFDLRKSHVNDFIDKLISLGFNDLKESNDPDAKCDFFYRIV